MNLAVHSRDVVIRKVCGHGCARRNDLDLPASYAFTYTDLKGKARLFFIPRELAADGYTIAQLQEIEEMLAYHGFDLLPLDPNLH